MLLCPDCKKPIRKEIDILSIDLKHLSVGITCKHCLQDFILAYGPAFHYWNETTGKDFPLGREPF